MAGTSPSTPTRSWTRGAMVRNTASSKRSGGHGARSGASHGRGRLDEVVDRHGPQVLLVHPLELLHVEERRGVVDLRQLEARHHLLDGEDLAALGVAPAEQRQVVAHGVGQVPALAVRLDRHVVAALGQLLAPLVHEQGQVGEGGQRAVLALERRPQQQPLGRRRQEVLAPDDVGDPHVDVVDHVGQHEQRGARRLHHHEVLDGVVGEDHVARG